VLLRFSFLQFLLRSVSPCPLHLLSLCTFMQ
jgi:hypothetical protein